MPDALSFEALPELDAPTLVLGFEGWNDAGESASGAVRFLAEAIRSTPLAEIDPEEYYDFTVCRPEVEMDAGGARRLTWPAYRFRYGMLGEHALITGIGSEPHLRWRSFSREVATLVERTGVRRVVLLGAFLADVLYSRPVRTSGFGSSDRFESLGIQASTYEGPTGIVGVLSHDLAELGCDTASLWAALPHYISLSPNPRGTLALMQKLAAVLALPTDLAPLEREAAAFETQVSELVNGDPALAQYVRDLKKREFAQ